MTGLYADTFYWIALTNTHDQSHRAAITLSCSISGLRIVTSESVLIEYLNYFAELGTTLRVKAAANVQRILKDPAVRVILHTTESFESGLNLYTSRPDKGYSLTDCISMDIMRREGLSEALTNDRHVDQEGFRALFRSASF